MLDVVSMKWLCVRARSAELELTYYCRVLHAGALSRTWASADRDRDSCRRKTELVVTLSGTWHRIDIPPVPVLARKVEEYERLKEFSEISSNPSTSESCRDLEDRSELEPQLEEAHRQHPNTRSDASSRNCGRRICCEQLASRSTTGVHNVYKYLLKERTRRSTSRSPR